MKAPMKNPFKAQMKAKIFGAVSALALLVALTAYTEANAGTTTNTNAGTSANASVSANADATVQTQSTTDARIDAAKADLKQGWEDAKQAVEGAADKATASTKAAYQDIKARVIDETTAATDVTISERMTARGMLGQPVFNTRNEKVGTLKDIVLDKEGAAKIAVVSDGGFMGIGDKLAAFDYNLVMRQEASGDVVMPLTDETLKQSAKFSYDNGEASDTVRVIPTDGYSVAELLKGKLVNPKGEAMGNIENITFQGGEASQVIVAFDQKAGVGGERAALDFDDLTLAKAGDGALDFRMNTRQSAMFEEFKGIKTNTN